MKDLTLECDGRSGSSSSGPILHHVSPLTGAAVLHKSNKSTSYVLEDADGEGGAQDGTAGGGGGEAGAPSTQPNTDGSGRQRVNPRPRRLAQHKPIPEPSPPEPNPRRGRSVRRRPVTREHRSIDVQTVGFASPRLQFLSPEVRAELRRLRG